MLSIIYYRMVCYDISSVLSLFANSNNFCYQIKFTRGDWVTKALELALKIADDIKKEREHALFKDLKMRDDLDKQWKTAFGYFKLDRSATVRRALSDNDSNSSKSVNKLNKVATSSNYREDAEGKLVRYYLLFNSL